MPNGFGWAAPDWFSRPIHDIVVRLKRIEILLKSMQATEAQVAIDLTAATAELARNTSLEGSIVQLVQTLADEIAALKRGSTDPATQAAIDALVAQLKNNDDAIAASVTANTPAAPPAPANPAGPPA